MSKKSDNPKCKKCGKRTALVKGYFYYNPDSEPYLNGKEEKAKVGEGEVYLSANVCDKCNTVQNINVE